MHAALDLHVEEKESKSRGVFGKDNPHDLDSFPYADYFLDVLMVSFAAI
jgi:hypothetical protein